MKNFFVDSNIWIYAHAESRDKSKHERSVAFLRNEVVESRIISSIQALNEFHWILLKKYGTTTRTLGNYLMGALPNATYIGLTGTPIDKTVYGKGIFVVFGKDDPPHGNPVFMTI